MYYLRLPITSAHGKYSIRFLPVLVVVSVVVVEVVVVLDVDVSVVIDVSDVTDVSVVPDVVPVELAVHNLELNTSSLGLTKLLQCFPLNVTLLGPGKSVALSN